MLCYTINIIVIIVIIISSSRINIIIIIIIIIITITLPSHPATAQVVTASRAVAALAAAARPEALGGTVRSRRSASTELIIPVQENRGFPFVLEKRRLGRAPRFSSPLRRGRDIGRARARLIPASSSRPRRETYNSI